MKQSLAKICLCLLVLFVVGSSATLASPAPIPQEEDLGTLSACIANTDGTTCNCMCTYSNGGGIFVDVDKPAGGSCSDLNGQNCEDDDDGPVLFPAPAWSK